MFSDLQTPVKGLVALCVAVCLLVVGGIYTLRSRQVNRKRRDQRRRRVLEKEKDSRALEDSLLQNTQGLILQFHAVSDHMAVNDPARRSLEVALLRAERVLADETKRVMALSQSDYGHSDLVRLFADAGREILGSRELLFRSAAEGIPRSLNALARAGILEFGREALLNAGDHSQAQRIEVHVVYMDEHLIVRIRDDGLGVGAEQIERSARSQQSGLMLMQYHAATLGAKLEVWSRVGAGTEVGLIVPAAIAYLDAAGPVEH